MSWLSYDRERVDKLWRRTRVAVDELADIRSDDPLAVGALQRVRRAQLRLETEWLPLLERVRASTALTAPIDLDADDGRSWFDEAVESVTAPPDRGAVELEHNGEHYWIDPIDLADTNEVITGELILAAVASAGRFGRSSGAGISTAGARTATSRMPQPHNLLRGKAAAGAAAALGYTRRVPAQKLPFNSHGQPGFFNGKTYITPDRDGHRGGVWKMYEGKKRLDANLNPIGDWSCSRSSSTRTSLSTRTSSHACANGAAPWKPTFDSKSTRSSWTTLANHSTLPTSAATRCPTTT